MGVEFGFCGFDAREAEDGLRDLFGVLHDRTFLVWGTVAQSRGLKGWRIWQSVQFYRIFT